MGPLLFFSGLWLSKQRRFDGKILSDKKYFVNICNKKYFVNIFDNIFFVKNKPTLNFATGGAAASGLRATLNAKKNAKTTVMVWAGDGGGVEIFIARFLPSYFYWQIFIDSL